MTDTVKATSAAVAFKTLGCKQNQFDARWLQSQLPVQHFSVTADLLEADWIVLTCCAVTERAMGKARGELHRLKRECPQAKVVVLGCGPRYRPDQFDDADFIDHLPDEFQISGYDEAIGSNFDGSHGLIPEARSRAYLRIQNGCDQFCAFCIVPHLRGISQSVKQAELIDDLRALVARGIAEIVLTGTNIALWGRDLDESSNLLELLQSCVPVLGNSRLRLSSLEPQFTPPELFEWCVHENNLCDHFHIAVQSGSDNILHRMGRGGLHYEFFQQLKRIKQDYPLVSLGADILVGFPGETEEDLSKTISLLEEVPFNYLHVFPYSEREGTRAATFPDVIDRSVRLERAAKLRELDSRLRRNFIQQNDRKTADVIKLANPSHGDIRGLTSNYLQVRLLPEEIENGPRFTTTLSETSFIQ